MISKLLISMIFLLPAWHPAPAQEMPSAPARPAWVGILVGAQRDGQVVVTAVVPGGPGEDAGVRPGDQILEIAGEKVADISQAGAIMKRFTAGEQIPIVLSRGGSVITRLLQSRFRERSLPVPDLPPALSGPLVERAETEHLEVLGLVVAGIPGQLRAHYGAPPDAGLLVTRVVPETVASNAGVLVGDIILGTGDERFATPFDLQTALIFAPPGQEIVLEAVRAGQNIKLPMAIPENDEISFVDPLLGRYLNLPELEKLSDGIADERVRMLEKEIQRLRGRIKELEHALEEARTEK